MNAAGRLHILGAAALFSTSGALIKSCQMTSWQVASLRSGFAVLALLFLCPGSMRSFPARALPFSVCYAATLILFVQATKLTTSAKAIFLQSTAPFFLLILAPCLLQERLNRRDLGFMAALAVGMALTFAGTELPRVTAPNPALGDILAVASGASWALTLTGLRKLGRAGGLDGMAAAVGGNLLAFLLCLPWALPLGAVRAVDWALIAFLGVVQIGLAYRWLSAGLSEVRALEASLLLLLEPVLNPIWAWLVHGETISSLSASGGTVILAATAAHAFFAGRRQRSSMCSNF